MVMFDTRSVTGRNLRQLRLMTANCNEKDLDVYNSPYEELPAEDMWRVSFAQELMEAKITNVVNNFSKEELNDILSSNHIVNQS